MRLSLSVEETNRLREQVGLRPIPLEDDTVPSEVVVKGPSKTDVKVKKLKASMAKTQDKLEKERFNARGGILDRTETATESDWIDDVGKSKTDKRLKFKRKEKPKIEKPEQVPATDTADSTIIEEEYESAQETPIKRKLVILDDFEDDFDDDLARSDYHKPKKLKKRKRVGQSVTKTESFNISKDTIKKIELVNEDLDDDTEDLHKFMAATRQGTLSRRPKPRETESSDGVVIDESTVFLDRFEVHKRKEAPTVVNASVAHEAPRAGAAERIGAILEAPDTSLGISSALKMLEDEPRSNGVNLVYKDDNGKVLTSKEAYKYMSRKFHGYKGSK